MKNLFFLKDASIEFSLKIKTMGTRKKNRFQICHWLTKIAIGNPYVFSPNFFSENCVRAQSTVFVSFSEKKIDGNLRLLIRKNSNVFFLQNYFRKLCLKNLLPFFLNKVFLTRWKIHAVGVIEILKNRRCCCENFLHFGTLFLKDASIDFSLKINCVWKNFFWKLHQSIFRWK